MSSTVAAVVFAVLSTTVLIAVAAVLARLVILTGVAVIVALLSRSWTRYLLLVLVVFLFSAMARRIFPGPSNDPAAFIPTLLLLPAAFVAFRDRLPGHQLAFLGTLLFALAFSFGQPLAGLVTFTAVAFPVLAGSVFRARLSELWILRALTLGLLPVGAYGIYQYFRTPSFDREWQIRNSFVSAGIPGTSDFRPWSTLPSPGTLAVVCVIGIIVLITRRDTGWWRWLNYTVLTLLVAVLAVGKVRAAWLALAVVLVYLVLARSVRLRNLVIAVLGIGLLIAVVPGADDAVLGIKDRALTLTSLSDDPSAEARLGLLDVAANAALQVPSGLGAASAGSRISGEFLGLDNGYVSALVEGGPVYLLGTLLLLVGQFRLSRSTAARGVVLAVALSNLGGFVITGITGFLLFLLSGRARDEVGVRAPARTDGHRGRALSAPPPVR